MKYITQFRLLEDYAQELLNRFQNYTNILLEPPIPIESIATDLFQLHLETREGMEGNGVLLTKRKAIIIDEESRENRTRFTIAHEIGHFILPDIKDDNRVIYYNIKGGEDPESANRLVESTVNKFAGALLIPRTFLKAELMKYLAIDDGTIKELARVFKVSELAMLFRIEYLFENGEKFETPIKWNSLHQLEHNNLMSKASKYDTSHKLNSLFRQLALNDITPFVREQNGSGDAEVVQVVNKLLTHMGVGTFSRRGKPLPISSPVDLLNRPFVIEFAGTPNSGKDTQIEILSEYLRDIHQFRVHVIDEVYRLCPSFPSQLDSLYWISATMVKNLVELANNPNEYDVIIFNRGLFDTLVFLHYYKILGDISSRDEKYINSFLCNMKSKNLVDVIFLLKIPPSESVSREEHFPREIISSLAREFDPLTLPNPPHRIVNIDGIRLLNDCYDLAFQRYSGLFKIIRLIEDYGQLSIGDISTNLVMNIHHNLQMNKALEHKPLVLGDAKIESDDGSRSELQMTFLHLIEKD